MAKQKKSRPVKIQDRVKELRRVRAGDLVPHPRNWRKHSAEQAAALSGVLREIGYAGAALVREISGGKLQLLDGHLRASLDPNQVIPVLVIDVDEHEAETLLLTLDPIAAMADSDAAKLAELATEVSVEDPALQALINTLVPTEGDDPVEIKQLPLARPPKMTWVLVGIPTVRFGEINQAVEAMAKIDDIIIETTFNDDGNIEE